MRAAMIYSEKEIAGGAANGATRVVEINGRHPHPLREIVRQSLCDFVR